MYRLSVAGVVFAVGVALWFRPVLGLLLFHRYLGAPASGRERHIRECVVLAASGVCIGSSGAVAVWTIQYTL